jgi:hypothetical protein
MPPDFAGGEVALPAGPASGVGGAAAGEAAPTAMRIAVGAAP